MAYGFDEEVPFPPTDILLPEAEKPARGAGGDAPAPAPAPAAPPAPNFSQYASLQKALEQRAEVPADDGTWMTRSGEDIYAALRRRKPDYAVADELAARHKARRDAPMAEHAQRTAAANADLKRSADMAREVLNRRLTESQITKNERAPVGPQVPADVQLFLEARKQDPSLTVADYFASKPQVQSAGIRADSASTVAGLRAEMDKLKLEESRAQGSAKLALQNKIAELGAQLKREGFTSAEEIADKRIEESKAKERRARLTGLGKATTPLAEGYGALKQILERFPELQEGLAPGATPDWLERVARRVPTGIASRALTDRNSQEFQMMVNDLRYIAQQARSGAAVTEDEARRYEEQFGGKLFDDPKLMANAILWYGSRIADKVRAAQAGNDNDLVDDYGATGAPSYRAEWLQPFYAPRTPAPTTTASAAQPPPGDSLGVSPVPPPGPDPAARASGEEKVIVEKDGKQFKLPRAQLPAARAQGYVEVGRE